MARGIKSTRREVPMAKTLVTYNVDVGTSYQEKVAYKKSVLSPTTFTPTKTGYTFLGWKLDGIASSDVLVTCIAKGKTMTLYAVFQQDITLTTYNASNTANTESKARYYNNSDILDPSFTLSETAVSGWNKAGWTNSSSGYTKTVNDGASVTLSADATYYSLYTKTITVTYYNNSSTASSTTGTRTANYHSSTTYDDPSFKLIEASVSGWTARGWSTSSSSSATITYNNNTSFTRDSDVTLYASWSKSVKVTYYNNSSTASSTTGTAYRGYKGDVAGASFKLAEASVSGWTARGWSTSSSASATITYSNNTSFTRDSDVTLYASWSKTITVTYYNNSTTASSTTGTAYRGYKGDVTGASFKLAQASKSGYTARGWSTSSSADATITYNNNTSFTRDSNVTLYGCYYYTVTITYNGNGNTGGSTASQSDYFYWNSSTNTKAPTFTIKSNGYSKTNYTYVRWNDKSDDTGAKYSAGSSISFGSSTTLYAIWVATTTTFNYTGAMQSFSAKSGVKYKVQIYGAQGGSRTESATACTGGYGGYTLGYRTPSANETWYIGVGGQGAAASWNTWTNGGWNGGGKGYAGIDGWSTGNIYGCSGGGASHIGLTNSTLNNVASNKLIAAAGGGGGGLVYINSGGGTNVSHDGGPGGGTNGGDAPQATGTGGGTGGSQSGPGGSSAIGTQGSYGLGGSGVNSSGYGCSGGGAGYYGGGGSNGYDTGGGGGSGYSGGLTSASMSQGQRLGNGQVIISVA